MTGRFGQLARLRQNVSRTTGQAVGLAAGCNFPVDSATYRPRGISPATLHHTPTSRYYGVLFCFGSEKTVAPKRCDNLGPASANPSSMRPSNLLAASLVTLLSVSACAVDATDIEDGIDEPFVTDGKTDDAISEGSPAALAVLKVASTATEVSLRNDIGLSARAAKGIVAGRVAGPYATLKKLDDVAYVGPAAFRALLKYAQDQGLIPATTNPLSASATRTPWSGYWWSMLNGELALGWDDRGAGGSRSTFSETEARAFDACVASYTPACKQTISTMAGERGRRLSPLMKFDYLVRKQLEATYGSAGAPASLYAHATKWELDQHYIGNNRAHRYWDSRGYAGKCIGWALATMAYDEPTKIVELDGVEFRPADIKGLLASIYNGAQFFVPEEKTIGNEFHNVAGSDSQAYYDDVHPHEFVKALFDTIGKGNILEADMDPGDGVWNYPLYKYELKVTRRSGTTAQVQATVYFANDEVAIDLVSAHDPARRDMKSRVLNFELTLPSGSDDLAKATGGRWLGASVNEHPDALILGVEADWRKTIYDYRNTAMNTEVNFNLIKRAQGSNGQWTPIVDGVLQRYYAAR